MFAAGFFVFELVFFGNVQDRINALPVRNRNIQHHAAEYIVGEMQAVVAKRVEPVPPFGYRADATMRVGIGFERSIKIRRRLVIARKGISVVFQPHFGMWNGLAVV